jgi:hypothetical protein
MVFHIYPSAHMLTTPYMILNGLLFLSMIELTTWTTIIYKDNPTFTSLMLMMIMIWQLTSVSWNLGQKIGLYLSASESLVHQTETSKTLKIYKVVLKLDDLIFEEVINDFDENKPIFNIDGVTTDSSEV